MVAGMVAGVVSGMLGPVRPAHGQDEPCTVVDARARAIAACFDPGNRVLVEASTAGYGGEIRARHRVTVEPGLWWRLEHRMLAALAGPARLQGALYEGRYLRHARDGHIVLPFRPTSKIFVPFDIGAEAGLGRIDWRYADDAVELDAVRVALLFELTRASHARHRLAVGPVARWGLRIDDSSIATVRDHRVIPFSRGLLDAYWEAANGLTMAGVRVEAGATWSSTGGWQRDLTAEATVERVLVAINDRPMSIRMTGRYDGVVGEWRSIIGIRLALQQRIVP